MPPKAFMDTEALHHIIVLDAAKLIRNCGIFCIGKRKIFSAHIVSYGPRPWKVIHSGGKRWNELAEKRLHDFVGT